MAPFLLAMKGHPATGKSSLARALAQQLGWPLLDKDDVKDHLLAVRGGNELSYAVLWQLVKTQLALGLSVIADSPLAYPVGYATVQQLAAKYSATLLVIETALPETVWRQRLEARPAEASAHKIRGWAAMQAQLDRYADCWRYPIAREHHVIVNTEQPLAQLVEQILATISHSPHQTL